MFCNHKRGVLTWKCLLVLCSGLGGIFLLLNYFGALSMNSLPIIVNEVEPASKPLTLLFIGGIMIAFFIVCVVKKFKTHKK